MNHEAIEADIVPENHGCFYMLDSTGDTRITWDRRDADEVANAQATFDKMRGKGFLAYSVNPTDATKGAILTTFDPAAEKIIFAPAHRGG